MSHLSASVASPAFLILRKHILPQYSEVWLMSSEGEHDQIGVKTVDDVLGVGIVGRVRTLTTDVVHDLVLAFSGNRGVRDDDFELWWR